MDLNKLNDALIALVRKKNELAEMSYSDASYDEAEEELHDREDEFLESYGDYLEEVLEKIHEEHFPESDVLLPIAYLADEYIEDEEEGFDVDTDQGVVVESEEYPNKICRLVFIPSPLRFVMIVGGSHRKVVWKAK
ncbi:MAG: hypothetical protein HC842_04195 [Cytophagales bacterium]|nr:hypothetical protein [Cytophagales bacterium]